eukprot:COSAG01_NODE_29449_length_637_cov_0.936803_1_plen_145_part_01
MDHLCGAHCALRGRVSPWYSFTRFPWKRVTFYVRHASIYELAFCQRTTENPVIWAENARKSLENISTRQRILRTVRECSQIARECFDSTENPPRCFDWIALHGCRPSITHPAARLPAGGGRLPLASAAVCWLLRPRCTPRDSPWL